MTKPVFEDIMDENGILHSKEDLEIAYEAELRKQREIIAKNNIVREITKRLDAFAKIKGFNTIESLAIRAGYPGPYNTIGLRGAMLMDNTWFKLDTIYIEVATGKREHPTSFYSIENELPKLEW
jgi:hypothetical protein